jgi:hypothetical protein
MSNTRSFRVQGNIACLFTQGTNTETHLIPNLEVELWHKAPLETIFLGKGHTNANGDFTIDFEISSPTSYIVDGKIDNVFLKAYYNGQLISAN